MILEQEGDASVILAGMAYGLQHFRQAKRLVAGTSGEYHPDAVSFVFGILVQTAGADFRTTANGFLHGRIFFAQFAA